jgi:hypothetical protein
MSSSVSLKRLDTGTTKIGSYPFAWALVWPILLFVWSGYLYAYASPEYRDPFNFETFFADTPADVAGWTTHLDEEMGIELQYPAYMDREVFGGGGNLGDYKMLNLMVAGEKLVSFSKVAYTGPTGQARVFEWQDIYNKRDEGLGIKWVIDDSYKAEGVYLIYPETPELYSEKVDPAYITVMDFDDNTVITFSPSALSLDARYSDDVLSIFDRVLTNKVSRPGI